MRALRYTRVALLLALTTVALTYGYFLVQRNSFIDPDRNRPRTLGVMQAAAEQYSKQSDKFSDWALAVLAGVVAVTVTTKVHEVKYCDYVFIALGPAGGLLVMSMRAGWEFQRRLANMAVHDDLSDIESLAAIVASQSDLFLWGLVLAMLFGSWYLVNIVIGNVQPHD
jgi:hypothetical protein